MVWDAFLVQSGMLLLARLYHRWGGRARCLVARAGVVAEVGLRGMVGFAFMCYDEANMSELRMNLIAREWVIVDTERPKAPEEFRRLSEHHYVPPHDPLCPFCPGNEDKTPPELMRVEGEGGAWALRVTLNKYSALAVEGERERMINGYKRMVTGVGRQEVIVEHPQHDMSLPLMAPAHVETVLHTYRDRFREAFRDWRIQHVIIFKNHGLSSGTTLRHPHTQLIGFPVMPFQVRMRIDEAMRFFDNTGECLMCGTVRDEVSDGSRIIVDSEHFLSFVPYAALSPFHTWIFPKRHQPSFASTSDAELKDMAAVLRETLGTLHRGLDDPDFNFVLMSVSPFRTRSEYLHWYLSIVPHTNSLSGFELGSGVHVNHSLPDKVAEYLRGFRES
jgi:UDPglucose--hexose-1-phosphate uridylyltransferase